MSNKKKTKFNPYRTNLIKIFTFKIQTTKKSLIKYKIIGGNYANKINLFLLKSNLTITINKFNDKTRFH